MTHDDIFHRACKEIRQSTSLRMLKTSENYFKLFERKCLDDGVNPQLIMAYKKVGEILHDNQFNSLK